MKTTGPLFQTLFALLAAIQFITALPTIEAKESPFALLIAYGFLALCAIVIASGITGTIRAILDHQNQSRKRQLETMVKARRDAIRRRKM